VGFSRTMGFELEGFFGALIDAWRMDWEIGDMKRVRQMALRCGSKNRGIAAAEDIVPGLSSELLTKLNRRSLQLV
jgi:hypothetical protein